MPLRSQHTKLSVRRIAYLKHTHNSTRGGERSPCQTLQCTTMPVHPNKPALRPRWVLLSRTPKQQSHNTACI